MKINELPKEVQDFISASVTVLNRLEVNFDNGQIDNNPFLFDAMENCKIKYINMKRKLD